MICTPCPVVNPKQSCDPYGTFSPASAPMESCTTYDYEFYPKSGRPRSNKKPRAQCPINPPLEVCSTYNSDYYPKCCGRVMSTKPLPCYEPSTVPLQDCTTYDWEFPSKSVEPVIPMIPCPSLGIPPGQMNNRCDTETQEEFCPKLGPLPVFPGYMKECAWFKPLELMDHLTTYDYFYQPHQIPFRDQRKVKSPLAVPFRTVHDLRYSCVDPKPCQTPPVEVHVSYPWPKVVTLPHRYQDALLLNPTVPFQQGSTYGCDYYPKRLFEKTKSWKRKGIYAEPIILMSGCTTQKCSYLPFDKAQMNWAKGNAGNPCGIYWGPTYSPNHCVDSSGQPLFPPPYGHPLKPNDPSCCPCGAFDERPMYRRDFKWLSPELLSEKDTELCQEVPCQQKGYSTSRYDFTSGKGEKAKLSPPPPSKSEKCLNPCSQRITDTLYNLNYVDYFKRLPRENMKLFKGIPENKKEYNDPEALPPYRDDNIEYKFVEAPKKDNNGIKVEVLNPQPDVDPNLLTSKEFTRCKYIPYSGRDILNRAQCAEVLNGHEGR